MTFLDTFNHRENCIIYDKRLAYITGSITSAILLQQIIYWYSKKKDKFYKFTAPCSHEEYTIGDSRCEELGITHDEFDAAIKKIGFKLGKNKNELKKVHAPVIYYTDSNRMTYYSINEDLLENLLKSYLLVNGKSPITKKMGIPQLLFLYKEYTENTTVDGEKNSLGTILDDDSDYIVEEANSSPPNSATPPSGETLESYVEARNSIDELYQKDNKGASHMVKGLPRVVKINQLLKDVRKTIGGEYSYEEIKTATNNYIDEIEGRKHGSDYTHRFTLYTFLKQGNGLAKFINM